MSYEERKGSSSFLYLLALIGAMLVMYWTVRQVGKHTAPPPLGIERAAERSKALAETRAADQAGLTTYAWQDKDRGIVRLPVDRAVELTLSEWQDPGAGRKKLLALSQKATAELPKAPEVPSAFE